MADIWTNLNTFKLGDVEAANIQRQTDPIHIEELNRSALEDTKLINDATMRSDGGIIPDTVAIKYHEFDDNGTVTVLEPAKGEIWKVLLPIARTISGSISTTPTYQLWLRQTGTSATYRIFYFASTSSAPILTEDANYWANFQFPICATHLL